MLSTTGCSREIADLAVHPPIVMVSLDTVRADRLTPRAMPKLMAWADRTLVYTAARSPAPFTMPAMASAMTGLYPHTVGIGSHSRSDRLATSVPTIAELARKVGYETVAVVTNPWLASADTGFARGFDRFVSGRSLGGTRARMSAREVVEEARKILAAERSHPLFLWLHFMDAHMPYDDSVAPAIARDFAGGPRERSRLFFEAPYTEQEIRATRDAYDAAITGIDTAIAPLLDALDAKSIVVVFADHGESLGEHGLHFAHDFTVYDELLRVPLLVKTADSRRGSVGDPVSLLDIVPTLCALARFECPPRLDGARLPGIATDRAEAGSERELFAASAPARRRYACPWLTVPGIEGRLTAAFVGGRKLIRMPTRKGPRYRAFDLATDRFELDDRFDAATDAALVKRLDVWTEAAANIAERSEAGPLPESVTRELEELGYLD